MIQSGVELLTLRNTHPSVDYLWIPCPRLHQVAVVVEVAKAELHPVFYVVVETLHFPNLVFIGGRSPQCNGAPSSSLLSRNEHPSCSRLQEIQYSEISFLILTLMSREKLTAHCHCPFIQVFTSQGQQVRPKEAKRC